MFRIKFGILFLSLLLLVSINVLSQNKRISGYIIDKASGERLENAAIYDIISNTGTYSNEFGYYSLGIANDSAVISVIQLGYSQLSKSLNITKSLNINFELESNTLLEEVVITAKQEHSDLKTISVAKIKTLPKLAGEQDILKTMQLFPGISAGSEGSSNLFVRGGDGNQNLVLLDGVPVYNINHAYGFISVFNSYSISHLNVYKGGFPARYTGRLSSVLDIRMKEGNMRKFGGNIDFSPVSPNLTIEGPIIKGKTSFIFSIRRTLLDLFLRLRDDFLPDDHHYDISNSVSYYFYDSNFKINHIISDKDRVFLSFYMGRDNFVVDQQSQSEKNINKTVWGNFTGVARWNHIYNDRFFSNLSAYYSKYNMHRYSLEEFKSKHSGGDNKSILTKSDSGLESIGAQMDWDWRLNPINNIRFGFNCQNIFFSPGHTVGHNMEDGFKFGFESKIPKTHALNSYIYIEDKINYKKFDANIGVNFSTYLVSNTIYPSIEPRAQVSFRANDKLSLHSSYSRITQNIHSLTNNSVYFSPDLLLPSTKVIKPMSANQIALGLQYSINKEINTSIDAYYKTMHNLIEYKNGFSEITQKTNWEEFITLGEGKSYGLEFLIEKLKGRFTGWASYTLSWSNRQFADLNNGLPFPFTYDRRHNISLVGIWNINEKVNLSATWVYYTGRAYTLSEAAIPGVLDADDDEDMIVMSHTATKLNGSRFPAYHRLDISANFVKVKKKGVQTWSIGVYNAYNRFNPYFMYVDFNNKTGLPFIKQHSILPAIPFVSYSYKF